MLVRIEKGGGRPAGGRDAERASIRTSIVAALALLATSGRASGDTEVARLAASIIRELPLQTEPLADAAAWHFSSKILDWILLGGIVLGAALLLIWVAGTVRGDLFGRRPAQWAAESEEAAAAEGGAASIMATADELAAEGRYVEAMHTLLLRALAEIRERLAAAFADSLTSREILRAAKLADAERDALRDIIQRVERTYFGEHPAQRADYEACRARFAELSRGSYGIGSA